MATLDQRTPEQKKIDLAYLRYVKNGIKLLEEKYGPDWVEIGKEVWEEDLFDIRQADSCVLGGVGRNEDKDYHGLCDKLGLAQDGEGENASWRYGFVTPSRGSTRLDLVGGDEDLSDDEEAFSSLQRLWVGELRARGVAI